MSKNTNIKSALSIQGLELHVYLGWPDDERSQKQIVKLNIEINFREIPNACETDDLENTICYSTLITYIRDQFAERKFRLLEHLTRETYQLLQNKLSQKNATIYVQIIKHPPIKGLTGVCFSYGEK